MKARLSLAAVLVAVAASSSALAQTGNDTVTQSKLERCQTIADPGLKAQCIDQARSTMGAGRTMQQMQQMPQVPGQDRPGLTPNLPPPDRRMNR
jgi:hypothetical protein